MNRRKFGLIAGTSLAALKLAPARAQAVADAGLLKTTLTPIGAERAGNAAGTIPAWTGGDTTIPAGWVSGDFMPSPYDDEPALMVIDASNMAQHTANLSDGVVAMIKKYGFSLHVYPTHRSAAAPQSVYDAAARNVATAQLLPGGGQLGFTDAFGAIPFPIPDASDPLVAGVQIMWNHQTRWAGYGTKYTVTGYNVTGGHVELAGKAWAYSYYPYYKPGGTPESTNDEFAMTFNGFFAPATSVGEQVLTKDYTDTTRHQNHVWELLNGQARVRMAPEVGYDSPGISTNGISNDDETYGFAGGLDRYDFKNLGKRELYIPYNNNQLVGMPGPPLHLQHFIDPQYVRWELHRVWVLEMTLRPGQRNVMATRRVYIDEDTWTVACVETYDANNDLFHVGMSFFYLRPDAPAVVMASNMVYNLQTDDYTSVSPVFDQKAHPAFVFTAGFPESLFDPENMAASSQY
jgi:hypothetical protein